METRAQNLMEIIDKKFSTLPYDRKKEIISIGLPTPDLKLTSTYKKKWKKLQPLF